MPSSADAQLAKFMRRYTPEVARLADGALAKMRDRLPGAVQLIYDNYNALVIGFGPSERASEAVFSIALYPRWVNLYFLQGALIRDGSGTLQGSGKQVRYIRLKNADDLDSPVIRDLMDEALRIAETRLDNPANAHIAIRAVAAKQRARVPRARAAGRH